MSQQLTTNRTSSWPKVLGSVAPGFVKLLSRDPDKQEAADPDWSSGWATWF